MQAFDRGSTLCMPHPLTGRLIEYRVPPRLSGSAAALPPVAAAGSWCAPSPVAAADADALLAWGLPLIAHGALPHRHPCLHQAPSPASARFVAALAGPRSTAWNMTRLCTLHATLMGTAGTSPLRAGTVWLNPSAQGRSGIADAAYVPTPAALLPELLQDLVTFLNDRRTTPTVCIVLAHFQLGCLHPFDDGNGRLIRALTLLLARELGAPVGVALLGLIGVMASKGRLIDAVPSYVRGDMTLLLALAQDLAMWVHDVLPTVASRLAQLEASLSALRSTAESRRRLLRHLRCAPWIAVAQVERITALAPNKSKMLIAGLCDEGILRPASGEVFTCIPVVEAWDTLLLDVKSHFELKESGSFTSDHPANMRANAAPQHGPLLDTPRGASR